jgi:signal recognition particle subunit SRP54
MKVEPNQTPGEQFIALLAAQLVEIMGQTQATLIKRTDGRPTVIILAGLQGAGKTTVAGKLSNYLLKSHTTLTENTATNIPSKNDILNENNNNKNDSFSKKILLVAADIYRPAAIEQLQTLGQKINVDVYTEMNLNPVQISRNAMKKAMLEKYDTVIIDTAGRQVLILRL